MGQFLGENIPYLVKDSGTQISLPATYLGQPTRLVLGGQGYKLNSALVCNLSSGGLDTGSLAANTLYYVYAVISGGNVVLEASLNAPSVGPVGFTQFRQIGRFRTFSGSASVAVVVNNYAGNGGRVDDQNIALYEEVTSYTVGATTTGPTFGTGTTFYRSCVREGEWAIVRWELRQNSLTGAAAGNGDYLLPLPDGLKIDYNKVYKVTVSASGHVGNGSMSGTSIVSRAVRAIAINFGAYIDKVYLFLDNDTTTGSAWGSTLGNPNSNQDLVLGVTARIPVVEFQGLFS